MITLNSIDLKLIDDPCFGEIAGKRCAILSKVTTKDCRTYKCPFYKPKECREWVRVEDRDGINLVPEEEYHRRRRIV